MLAIMLLTSRNSRRPSRLAAWARSSSKFFLRPSSDFSLGRVAGEQNAPQPEILRHALVHLVDALVLDLVALLTRQEVLHAPLDHLLRQRHRVLLLGRDGEDHPPDPRRPVVRHLEKRGTF